MPKNHPSANNVTHVMRLSRTTPDRVCGREAECVATVEGSSLFCDACTSSTPCLATQPNPPCTGRPSPLSPPPTWLKCWSYNRSMYCVAPPTDPLSAPQHPPTTQREQGSAGLQERERPRTENVAVLRSNDRIRHPNRFFGEEGHDVVRGSLSHVGWVAVGRGAGARTWPEVKASRK